MNPLVSIVVPVYNVEDYIEKCVDSLLEQTYENIEVLLINDGSSDNSGCICDSLATSDSRIRVIHQENAGVSAARNKALDNMKGEYVTFVDADDYVATDFIECLYNAITEHNADISTCGHYRVEFDASLKQVYHLSDNPEEIICMSGKDSIMNMFYEKICSASSGSKLYKSELFNNLRFPGFIMGEDTFVVYYAFRNSAVVAHTNKPLYYYVQHSASVTNSKSNYFKFYDYVRLYDHIINSDDCDHKSEYYRSIVNRLIENNFWVYMKLRNCPNMFFEEKMHIENNIKKYRKYVIANPKAKPRVRIACALSYGGMNTLNVIYDNITN